MAIDISNINQYNYSFETTGKGNVRRASSQLGDNYTETRVKGINPATISWDVRFIFSTLASAQDFVSKLNSGDLFLWRSPLDNGANLYMASGWSITPESPIQFTIGLTMTRWYGS